MGNIPRSPNGGVEDIIEHDAITPSMICRGVPRALFERKYSFSEGISRSKSRVCSLQYLIAQLSFKPVAFSCGDQVCMGSGNADVSSY